jgi:hypothetical protein
MLKHVAKNVWCLFWKYIVNRYRFTNVLGNGFKYIHCDLADPIGDLRIVLSIRSNFVYTFSPHLNIWSFIRVLNFGVTFKNMFERGDWKFLLKVEATIIIEWINLFFCLLALCPYTFCPWFHANNKFGVKRHGINGH